MRILFAITIFFGQFSLAQSRFQGDLVARQIGLDFVPGTTMKIHRVDSEILNEGKYRAMNSQYAYWIEEGSSTIFKHERLMKTKRQCSLRTTDELIQSPFNVPINDLWLFEKSETNTMPLNIFDLLNKRHGEGSPRNSSYRYTSIWVSSSEPRVRIELSCFFSSDAKPISSEEKKELSISYSK